MDIITLNVTGMTCGGCENAIKRGLATVPGVQSVEASHQTGAVTLQIDPARFDRAAALSKLEKLGYSVRG